MNFNKLTKKSVSNIILAVCILLSVFSYSQEKKPKVALVLSGGGAKGVAHIPLLEKLDSLGIVPDLVVGNSMGSIMGGLYSTGYSGAQIADLIQEADWENLIGGDLSLRDVTVEEKSEYGRYVVKSEFAEGELLFNSLISDQNINTFLTYLTLPVYNIKDFDNLPIPFRAVATDIVKGKEVILENGSLAFAMRASMSIPGAFSPIDYGDALLIDGGILNNYPADVAKQLGADIIIGSNVGSGLQSKKELNNISSLLFQAAMLNSNLKLKDNEEITDLFIDHLPNLSYSTADFTSAIEIYNEGKIAVRENSEELEELASYLKQFSQKEIKRPDFEKPYKLDSVRFKNFDPGNLDLVIARTKLETNNEYTREKIVDNVNRAMGTTLFKNINLSFFSDIDEDYILEVQAVEREKNIAKASLHYNTYHGAGVILNYTGRNIFGNSSRALATIDVAQQPNAKLQYQKNFGKSQDFWVRSEIYGQRLEREIYVKGENADNLRYAYLKFENQINRNLNPLKDYIGAGVKYQLTDLKPINNPNINTNFYSFENFNSSTIDANLNYVFNSLNDPFFATKGMYLESTLSRVFYSDVDISLVDDLVLNYGSDVTNNTKFLTLLNKYTPIHPKVSIISGAKAAFNFSKELDKINNADYGYGTFYVVGGEVLSPNYTNLTFPGLYESEILVSQMLGANLEFQINVLDGLYITPHVDAAMVGFKSFEDYFNNFTLETNSWSDFEEQSIIVSTGVKGTYNTIIGPISLNGTYVNDIDKFRAFLSAGFNIAR